MQNEKFKSAIHEAMERDYRNLTKSSENHMFSPKFEKRMKRLIGAETSLIIESLILPPSVRHAQRQLCL